MRSPSFLAALLAALLGVACATRASVPPSGGASPLSPAHRPGVTAPVTVALDEDPPLPGDPQGAWVGLDPQPPSADGAAPPAHAHHGAPAAAPGDAGVDPHAGHRGAAPDAGAALAPTHEHGGGHAH